MLRIWLKRVELRRAKRCNRPKVKRKNTDHVCVCYIVRNEIFYAFLSVLFPPICVAHRLNALGIRPLRALISEKITRYKCTNYFVTNYIIYWEFSNFGHGKKNLSVIMATLMMLAFQIDQIQECCCAHFQAALNKSGRRTYLWDHVRSFIEVMVFENWEDFYGVISKRLKVSAHIVNSS